MIAWRRGRLRVIVTERVNGTPPRARLEALGWDGEEECWSPVEVRDDHLGAEIILRELVSEIEGADAEAAIHTLVDLLASRGGRRLRASVTGRGADVGARWREMAEGMAS